MASNRKTNRYNSGKGNEGKMAQALDDLTAFEDFRADILPKLRIMLKDGKSATEIYQFAQSFAAARAVTIGVSSPDERNALSAIKEILDRGVGKAAEKLEVTTRYEQLPDDVLDQMLAQQEAQLDGLEDERH